MNFFGINTTTKIKLKIRPEVQELTLNLKDHHKAKYLQIAGAIRYAIKQKQVASGDALPSARKLAEQLNTNRHTVMAAYAELVAEGWVESQQRSAYRVSSLLPIQSSKTTSVISTDLIATQNTEFKWHFVRQGIRQNDKKASDYRYNFSGGQPDIASFPFTEFNRCFAHANQYIQPQLMSYGDSLGEPQLIAQITTYLRRVRAITDKQLMICNGSQEALYIVSQLLLQQNDLVAVEQLGYPPAWEAFKSTGAKLVAIKQDEQGMIPEHLEEVLKKSKVKLIYLTPLHQYPTTITLSISRRMQIYQLAVNYGVAIVEDDYDHEFHYKCQPLAPMAADDAAGLVIYISTFSKLMFGAARIGYLVANSAFIEQAAAFKTLINHKSNVMLQQAVAYWMKTGGFERHLRRMTKRYQQRRDAMVVLLTAYQRQGYPISFQIPDGGMALWVNMGKSVLELKKQLFDIDVYLQTGIEFDLCADKKESSQHIRLGFAAMTEQQAKEGLQLIINHLYGEINQ